MITIDDIRAQAATNAVLTAAIAARDTAAIAAALPPKTVPNKTAIGVGTIVIVMGLGPGGGGQFIRRVLRGGGDALPAGLKPYADDVAELLGVIDQGNLDMSLPEVRAIVDQMAQLGVMTELQAAALKALGEDVQAVTEFEVRRIAWADNGDWLI